MVWGWSNWDKVRFRSNFNRFAVDNADGNRAETCVFAQWKLWKKKYLFKRTIFFSSLKQSKDSFLFEHYSTIQKLVHNLPIKEILFWFSTKQIDFFVHHPQPEPNIPILLHPKNPSPPLVRRENGYRMSKNDNSSVLLKRARVNANWQPFRVSCGPLRR